jgi:hypothetical protein
MGNPEKDFTKENEKVLQAISEEEDWFLIFQEEDLRHSYFCTGGDVMPIPVLIGLIAPPFLRDINPETITKMVGYYPTHIFKEKTSVYSTSSSLISFLTKKYQEKLENHENTSIKFSQKKDKEIAVMKISVNEELQITKTKEGVVSIEQTKGKGSRKQSFYKIFPKSKIDSLKTTISTITEEESHCPTCGRKIIKEEKGK